MSKKSIIVSIIVLVLVLAGALGYLTLVKKPASVERSSNGNVQNIQQPPSVGSQNQVSQQPYTPEPAEIANWKTYTSNDAGFEIKYPEEWEISVSGNRPGNVIVEFAPKNFEIQTGLLIAPISITEHYFQTRGLSQYLNQFKTSDIKEILINNIPAKEVKGEYFHAPFHGIYIDLQNSNDFLEIIDNIENYNSANRISSEEAMSLDNVFNQILSTFRFFK